MFLSCIVFVIGFKACLTNYLQYKYNRILNPRIKGLTEFFFAHLEFKPSKIKDFQSNPALYFKEMFYFCGGKNNFSCKNELFILNGNQ
jgi:hypothetical protein